jgi:cell division protein ZapA (FtsZ GTPase activity inhibitor)
MAKSIRVKIGGQDYNLRSNDENKTRDVARYVDEQMKYLRANAGDKSQATLSILTALNIAEQSYDGSQQANTDKEFVVSELEKMSTFLTDALQKAE